jgi:adenine-specific DNA-methyltransferase
MVTAGGRERIQAHSVDVLTQAVHYHPRRHAAVRTNDYIFSQLIPYIGNKRKLLPLIMRAIRHTGCQGGLFVDLFTGSTVVARLAKSLGYRVLANDWEPYSYEIARGTVAVNHIPAFSELGGARRVFDHLNGLEPLHGYIAQHLCPQDDERPDTRCERMFFTRQNGERIDAMRDQIAIWEAEGRLSADERGFLLSALVYAVSYASNTSGVFKGFHNGWGGKSGTALYRIRGSLTLTPPVVLDNGQTNIAMREDAQRLAAQLCEASGQRPDIVYIDPPYNQHPYGSNYHVLNTVVLWDKPKIHPQIIVNGRRRDKSAIRKDWRSERRSPYNSEKEARCAFKTLVDALDSRWVLLSYSTDGNIATHHVLRVLAARGDLHVFTRTYKRYRVSTPRMSAKSHNVEFLAVLDTEGPPSPHRVDEVHERIMRQEDAAVRPRLQVMGIQ